MLLVGTDAIYIGDVGQNVSRQGGTGPIFLSTLNCDNLDNSIIECPKTAPIGLTKCTHSQDVYVQCEGKVDHCNNYN